MQEINKRNARVWSMLGMRRVVGMLLEDMVQKDEKFMFLTADVARYFGTGDFEKNYPNHILDVGIAEQNLVGVAAGMQKEGLNVFAATYATFITARALDQIRVNLGYADIGVKLIGVGGGLAEGDLSATHMGLEDIADMRTIPNMTVISPADATELIKTLYALLDYDKPTYVRLTGKTNIPVVYTQDYKFEIGKAVCLHEGTDIAIVANGVIVGTAMKVVKKLEEQGISCKLINMHTIKPIDTEILEQIADHKLVVTIEEHMKAGGLGSAVAEYYAEQRTKPYMKMFAIEDFYPKATEYEYLLEDCGLTASIIFEKISNIYKEIGV